MSLQTTRQKKPKPKPKKKYDTYPIAAIGIDPGGTTGVAVFLFDGADSPAVYDAHYQFGDPDNVWRSLKALAEEYRQCGYLVVLVIEQFDKRPGVINPDFTPKFVNRDIENNITEFDLEWQLPVMAKNFIPDGKKGRGDALKRFGWYNSANKHANDAARHVLVFAVERLRHMPTILKGWPKQ